MVVPEEELVAMLVEEQEVAATPELLEEVDTLEDLVVVLEGLAVAEPVASVEEPAAVDTLEDLVEAVAVALVEELAVVDTPVGLEEELEEVAATLEGLAVVASAAELAVVDSAVELVADLVELVKEASVEGLGAVDSAVELEAAGSVAELAEVVALAGDLAVAASVEEVVVVEEAEEATMTAIMTTATMACGDWRTQFLVLQNLIIRLTPPSRRQASTAVRKSLHALDTMRTSRHGAR